jgi:transposase
MDAQLRETKKKLAGAIRASGTTVTEVFGVGPVVAGTVIGDVRYVSRFPGRDHFAACNGTAPVEVSSGEPEDLPAVAARQPARESRHPHGRDHPDPPPAQPWPGLLRAKAGRGKTHKEGLRALKRRISDAIYVRLVADARRPAATCPEGPGGQPGNHSVSRAAAHTPSTGSSGKPLPGLTPPYGQQPSQEEDGQGQRAQTPPEALDSTEVSIWSAVRPGSAEPAIAQIGLLCTLAAGERRRVRHGRDGQSAVRR